MSVKSRKPVSKPLKQAASATASVTLRVRRDHLTQLDAIAAAKGTVRAAQIQTAIADYIKREAQP